MTTKVPDRLSLNPRLSQMALDRITAITEEGANGDFFSRMLATDRSSTASDGAGELIQEARDEERVAMLLDTPALPVTLPSFTPTILASTQQELKNIEPEFSGLSFRTRGAQIVMSLFPSTGDVSGSLARARSLVGSADDILSRRIFAGKIDAEKTPLLVNAEGEEAPSRLSLLGAPPNPLPSVLIGSFETFLPAAITQTLADTPAISSISAPQSCQAFADSRHPASPVKILAIQLEPAHLGALQVKFRFSDRRLALEIGAETKDAAVALDREKDRLIETLQTAGFNVESLELRVNAPAATSMITSDMAKANVFASEQLRDGHSQGRHARQTPSAIEEKSDTESGPSTPDHRSPGGVYL